jgi:hypothetical protein
VPVITDDIAPTCPLLGIRSRSDKDGRYNFRGDFHRLEQHMPIRDADADWKLVGVAKPREPTYVHTFMVCMRSGAFNMLEKPIRFINIEFKGVSTIL